MTTSTTSPMAGRIRARIESRAKSARFCPTRHARRGENHSWRMDAREELAALGMRFR